MKKGEEAPAGFHSLKERGGGMYFTGGVLASDRRKTLVSGNSVRVSPDTGRCIYVATETRGAFGWAVITFIILCLAFSLILAKK